MHPKEGVSEAHRLQGVTLVGNRQTARDREEKEVPSFFPGRYYMRRATHAVSPNSFPMLLPFQQSCWLLGCMCLAVEPGICLSLSPSEPFERT